MPNPMPESVTDRPTKSHEYVFLLSKGPQYFYDADAIREPHGSDWIGRASVVDLKANSDRNDGGAPPTTGNEAGRNKRSVWTVATQPYAGAHFATFPPKLIEPCVLAGAPERACGECGAPWVIERRTIGFEPSCAHGDGSARGVVLDPFAGAGTTGIVALQHGREFVGIELNPEYAAIARDRIETAVRLGFRAPQNGREQIPGQLDIFGVA